MSGTSSKRNGGSSLQMHLSVGSIKILTRDKGEVKPCALICKLNAGAMLWVCFCLLCVAPSPRGMSGIWAISAAHLEIIDESAAPLASGHERPVVLEELVCQV